MLKLATFHNHSMQMAVTQPWLVPRIGNLRVGTALKLVTKQFVYMLTGMYYMP